MNSLDDASLDLIFRNARTYNSFTTEPVSQQLIREVYELAKMGPTAANIQPLRWTFVTTTAGKEKLRPAVAPGNLDKTMAAPVTAIAAWDTKFYDNYPRLFPAVPSMHANVSAMPAAAQEKIAIQSSYLAIGYFILAARSRGLACGPMAGFTNEKVDAAFFPNGEQKSLLLINVGFGETKTLYPRGPRLSFDEACRFE